MDLYTRVALDLLELKEVWEQRDQEDLLALRDLVEVPDHRVM